MRSSPNEKQWSEYRWEREIRMDEKRISSYFKELPLCLDLPGEEDNIMKKLMAQPDLVPSNAEWSGFSFSDMFFDDEDEELLLGGDWKNKKGADSFIQLEKIACEWNVIFAAELRPANLKGGIALICLMGKLLARCADMLEVEDDEMRMLKLSLAKRMLADINELVGALRDFKRKQPDLEHKINGFIEHLQSIREKTIDLIAELKAR